MKSIGLFVMVALMQLSVVKAQERAILHRRIKKDDIKVGAQRTRLYFPLLKDKSIAVVANQTSVIDDKHLVDSLLAAGFNVKKVFCPEHGFRGLADAGETIKSNIDERTGLPIISLYGSNKKPTNAILEGIDIVIFDIQDVGVRFYTYISTMHYVMEACAENNITVLILDRPNPNGFYIDGPVLEDKYKSFVGMHPVPLVHGMTIAEYACMINEEGWLENGIKCDLKYVQVWDYNHTYYYKLPIKPSPNLPNMAAVYLYPSLALFEGTDVSVGRGTDFPFQVFGSPNIPETKFSFTPETKSGAKYPKHEGKKCYGHDLRSFANSVGSDLKQIYLFWILETYKQYKDKSSFFNSYFYNLTGTGQLRKQIENEVSEEEIRASWQAGIENFKKIRKKYLLYPDFE